MSPARPWSPARLVAAWSRRMARHLHVGHFNVPRQDIVALVKLAPTFFADCTAAGIAPPTVIDCIFSLRSCNITPDLLALPGLAVAALTWVPGTTRIVFCDGCPLVMYVTCTACRSRVCREHRYCQRCHAHDSWQPQCYEIPRR